MTLLNSHKGYGLMQATFYSEIPGLAMKRGSRKGVQYPTAVLLNALELSESPMIHESSARIGNRRSLALFLAHCGPILLLGATIASIYPVSVQAQEPNDWFESKVRPILVEHCYECHSGTKSKGGLLLDSKRGWSQGGQSGPAILPGDPDQSLLIQAVEYETHQMPPKGKLTDRQIETLIEWVQKGAPDP